MEVNGFTVNFLRTNEACMWTANVEALVTVLRVSLGIIDRPSCLNLVELSTSKNSPQGFAEARFRSDMGRNCLGRKAFATCAPSFLTESTTVLGFVAKKEQTVQHFCASYRTVHDFLQR